MKSTRIKRFYTLFVLYATVIALCCVMSVTQPILNLSAGGPSDGTFYVNAPVFVAGDTNRSETTGSADTSGALNSTAKDKALFKTDGTINTEVLADLLFMVDNEKVWGSTTENTGTPTYLSAKNFGQYGTQTGWDTAKQGNAQILVKLFETTTDSTSNVNALTSQYWQAVYRSINGVNDVLTLYMVRPYLTSQQFDSSYGNYSKSAVRTTILSDYTTLSGKFANIDQYVVAPYQLSSSGASDMSKTTVSNPEYLNLGGWQSSAYQTSNSAPNLTGTPSINGNWLLNTKLGASGYCDANDTSWGYEYGVNNGLDGLGDGWKSWTSIDSNYTDKLWLPSGFEVLHTGYDPNNSANISRNENNGIYDGNNDIIYLDNSNYGKASAGINTSALTTSHTNENRTGLWELNGYDRASNSWAWLRSGNSYYNNIARGVSSNGGNDSLNVNVNYGVRAALHLNLKYLTKELCEISASPMAGSIAAKSVAFHRAAQKYNQYIVKSSTSSSNSQLKSTSFTLAYDSDIELKSLIFNSSTQSIELNSLTAGQTYTASGICDYAVSNVTTNADGDNEITITISNAKTNEVNVKYQIMEAQKEYTVAFRTTFVNTTGEYDAGLVIYILRSDGVGGYAEFYSIFVKREEQVQTFEFTLQGEMTYTLLVCKPYLWQISLDGTANTTKMTFTPQNNNEIHNIIVSGGDIPNNYTVV